MPLAEIEIDKRKQFPFSLRFFQQIEVPIELPLDFEPERLHVEYQLGRNRGALEADVRLARGRRGRGGALTPRRAGSYNSDSRIDPAWEAVVSESAQKIEGLVFTDAAARKVGELIREEGNPKLKLRVFVSGGGCSGFQYGFTFDEKIEDGDAEFPNQGVTLLVDPLSFQYLAGAEIDYREDLEGAQFVIRNPNATTTCGCGSSFST